jgi:hypothetical protein
MAAFASCRRSGWVRLLVVILCAFFIFATLAAPPAQALGVESVAVFGLASVLSAATAALGFKLSSNEQGQATLQRMVQDFKTVAWATGFVLVGSKLNGLQNGMDYIKIQVQNGKTYLDARVFAWVQQWLSNEGVYSTGTVTYPNYQVGQTFDVENLQLKSFDECMGLLSTFVDASGLLAIVEHYNLALSGKLYDLRANTYTNFYQIYLVNPATKKDIFNGGVKYIDDGDYYFINGYMNKENEGVMYSYRADTKQFKEMVAGNYNLPTAYCLTPYHTDTYAEISNLSGFSLKSNTTGLSGTDTLGKDVIDLTLDQILEKLKEWAQDWFDAGADSATNAATGALDLPLTVSAGAATANPSIAEDGPLVWFPPFSVPIPNLRTGETDTNTVDQGKENASAAETSTVDVAENQSVIDSLVNWALSYISPDTGLFSKFPLCVPYDAYLLVTSSLGVDAVGSDSIFGASPGDLDGVVNQDIETYSDFQPIINIKHDFELDGKTYPVDLTIDLTPWQPLVTFFREGMALLLVAELIGSEFKRIRGH